MDPDSFDKELLLRYLRGEIPFEQLVQGNQDIDQDQTETTASPRHTDAIEEEEDEEEDDEEDEDDDDEEEDEVEIVGEENLHAASTSQGNAPKQVPVLYSSSADEFQEMTDEAAMNMELELMRGSRRRRPPPSSAGSSGHLHRPRRRRSRVPKDLRGLLGQAHLCFARKEHTQATKMCMEIVRQAPRSVEPFQLLAMIYEDQGDMEKSMQFQLIAAHVSPRDTEQWQQLAEACIERQDLKKAVYCYTKALKVNHRNIPLLQARASLYTKLGDHRRATESYQHIIKALPPEESHKSVQLARELVQNCHKLGDTTMAIDTLELMFKKYPQQISSEDVNNLSELYISSRQYMTAVKVMCDYCGVKVDFNNADSTSEATEGESREIDIFIPDGLPIDLRIKLAVCLIHTRHLPAVAMVTEPLFSENPEEMGDLYLDVAEAYVEINMYKEAKPILSALVAAKNYNLPAVWLRYAECLNSLGELAEASRAYKEVLKQVPRHLDARLALAAIEQQLGRAESALQALTLDPVDDADDQVMSKQDIQILFRQCSLLHTQGHTSEFVEKALNLLAKYLMKDQEDHANYSVITKAEWFGLVQKANQSLGMVKKYKEACGVLTRMLDSNLFEKEGDKIKKLKFMLICASYLNGNYENAFYYVREFVSQWGHKNNVMNLFSLIVSNMAGTRHHRFCLRLTIRLYSDSQALCMINGHNALQTGSYKHAIAEYVRAYHQNPSDPFIPLCIGISLFAIASQKFTINKDSVISQGFSALRLYQRLRGDTQESNYNIGRALQQVGMTHLAVHYYHKALTLPSAIPNDDSFDLRPQIAFNLSLIYRQNGNEEMAVELLSMHCVI